MLPLLILELSIMSNIYYHQVTCPECAGTGYDFGDGGQCDTCNGTGEIEK